MLVLFIASMAVHYVLQGLGLVFFGGEGLRSAAFSDARFTLGVIQAARRAWVILASIAVMVAAVGCSSGARFTARRCAPPR